MGYFKEFISYVTPFFDEHGFKIIKGKRFERDNEFFTDAFEFNSYSSGTTFKFHFGVKHIVFDKIFENVVGWGLPMEYALFVTSYNSFIKILKADYDVDNESDFPDRLSEVKDAFHNHAVPFYKKNNSLLSVRNNLRGNEIFIPMIGNTDFYLVDWKVGVFTDLLITKIYEPEKFNESVEYYRIKCTTKHSRGYGENPNEIIDYSTVYQQVETEFLPKLVDVNWDAYRKKLKI